MLLFNRSGKGSDPSGDPKEHPSTIPHNATFGRQGKPNDPSGRKVEGHCTRQVAVARAPFRYSRSRSHASFVFGLLVILVALLLENILNSPLLFTAFNAGPGGLGRFLTIGQFLMAVALAVFLYLSLE